MPIGDYDDERMSSRRFSDRGSNRSYMMARTTTYVAAIVVLCAMATVFVLSITFLRPQADNGTLIASVLGLIVPVVMALLAAAVQRVSTAVNGRLTELLEVTARNAHAEGKLAMRAEKAPQREPEGS